MIFEDFKIKIQVFFNFIFLKTLLRNLLIFPYKILYFPNSANKTLNIPNFWIENMFIRGGWEGKWFLTRYYTPAGRHRGRYFLDKLTSSPCPLNIMYACRVIYANLGKTLFLWKINEVLDTMCQIARGNATFFERVYVTAGVNTVVSIYIYTKMFFKQFIFTFRFFNKFFSPTVISST